MSSGYLIPNGGLWFLGDQCGTEIYLDSDDLMGPFIERDIVAIHEEDGDYESGALHGMSAADALKQPHVRKVS